VSAAAFEAEPRRLSLQSRYSARRAASAARAKSMTDELLRLTVEEQVSGERLDGGDRTSGLDRGRTDDRADREAPADELRRLGEDEGIC
jgi:hypothetical protein